MFSSTGPEEIRRPTRRPITAPTQMPSCLNSNLKYATEVKPAPGEKTKPRTGFKPANANLRSTVFNLQSDSRGVDRKSNSQGKFKPALINLPSKPRIRTRPLHRNEISSLFLSEKEVDAIKKECSKRPMSVSLNGILSEAQKVEVTSKEGQNLERKTANDTYRSKIFEDGQSQTATPALFSADDKMAFMATRNSSVANKQSDQSIIDSSIWSSNDHGVVRCSSRRQCAASQKMQESTCFKPDDVNIVPSLWSSDQKMASFNPIRGTVSNDTFKSTVFNDQCDRSKTWKCFSRCDAEKSANFNNNKVGIISKDLPKSVIIETNSKALHDEAIDSSFSDSEIRLLTSCPSN